MKETIKLENYTIDEIKRLIGQHDENIRLLEEAFEMDITLRGDEIVFDSDEKTKIHFIEVIHALLKLDKQGKPISKRDVMYTLKLSETNNLKVIDELLSLIHI